MPDCVSKNAMKVGKGGWNQLHKEVLHDLYLLSVVQANIGLHILSAEYNRHDDYGGDDDDDNDNDDNNNNNNTS
jgi:hypothetical protein